MTIAITKRSKLFNLLPYILYKKFTPFHYLISVTPDSIYQK